MTPAEDIAHIMNVTAFKDEETATAARETLIWLENGAPHKFDGLPGAFRFNMNTFLRGERFDDVENTCGTACCMAGAISEFKWLKKNPGKKRVDGYKEFYTGLIHVEFTQDIRDIKLESQTIELFFGYTLQKKGQGLYGIKPDEAAKVLRNYLFTGETDWFLAFPELRNADDVY